MRVIKRRSTVKEGRKDTFRIYDSFDEFATEVATIPARDAMWASSWYGGLNWQEAVTKCRDGAPEMVAASDKLMERMDGITAPRLEWQSLASVVGNSLDYGNYLTGSPNMLRRRVRQPVETSPLTIVVDLTVSGSVSQESMIARGMAALALARLLCGVRPVTLYALCSTAAGHNDRDGHYTLVPVPAAPLDLARAAYALAHPAFVRGLCYQTATHFADFKGHWPYRDHDRPYVDGIHDLLGGVIDGADKCLYLKGIHSSRDPAVADPVEWVREMLVKHGTPEE